MPIDPLSLALGGATAAAGLAMVAAHLVARPPGDIDADDATHEYLRRRKRRRLAASSSLAAVGLAVVAGPAIRALAPPQVFVVFWLVVLALLAAIVVVALIDALATRTHFARIGRKHEMEKVALTAELRRRKAEINGSADFEHE